MILEKLSVAGFRTFAERLEFTPDARFTVIHAPNGTGKSTLLDALYYGLLERHSVSGAGAEQRFRPLGRELTPTIEIDFVVDKTRYRLRKTFLTKAKSAVLQRFESGRYVALKDGSPADDFVRDLFFAEAPGKGPIEPSKHLGFAHVLWAPAHASFVGLPQTVGDQIRAMFGGATLAVTEGERMVQERATTEYQRFFKNDGGYTTKAGAANVPAFAARLTAAHEAEVQARQHYLSLEQLSVAYTDREAEAERMNSVRTQLRADIEAMKSALNVYTDLKTSAERAARSETDARIAYEHVTTVIRSLAGLRTERAALEIERAECSQSLNELVAAAAVLHERFHSGRKALENAGAVLGDVQRRAGDVTAARSYLDSCESVERLRTLVAAYDVLAARLAEITAAQTAVVAPTLPELQTLRETSAQMDTLQATIAASALSLDIEALADVTIEVIAGEKTGPMTLAAGSTTTIAATDESVVVDIPGLGRIRARGADGAAKARKKVQPLIAQLEAARERFGTASIPELTVRAEHAEELKRTALQTQTSMADVLNGQSIKSVRELLAVSSARVASIESGHPAWHIDRPDAAALRTCFDRDLQQATDASNLAQMELSAVERPKNEVDARIAELRTADAGLAIKLETIATQLQSLEADGFHDLARTERQELFALTWTAAKAEQTNIAQALACFVEGPQAALKRLENAEREAGTAYEKALGEAKTYRARLDMQANLGSYAKLAAAEELVAQCTSELAAAQAQASAVTCLYRAFERIQSERLASVIGPITSASTQYLTRIVGSPRGKIEIGDGLSPSGLIDAASGLKLLIDGTLSSGETEQIYLATRLALADVIAKGQGRQLFVVDDALTATDPNRLRRFVGILEELSRERLQVIVTTADPSRYLGIPGAKHVDLATALLAELAA
jgi:hypothetical protein